METKDTNIMKLSGCLSLSDFVRSRPFRNPCTSAARVCMETEEKNKQSLKQSTIRMWCYSTLSKAGKKSSWLTWNIKCGFTAKLLEEEFRIPREGGMWYDLIGLERLRSLVTECNVYLWLLRPETILRRNLLFPGTSCALHPLCKRGMSAFCL